MDIPSIETSRLLLRAGAPAERDLDAIERIMCDEENFHFIGGPAKDRMACWNGIARWLGHWELRGFGMFVLEERASGDVVGRVGLLNPDGWPGIEVGWLVDKRRWGKGFAPEAARAVLGYAFEELGIEHLISLIHPDNRASIRVAEKIGETLERTTELDGTELVVYGIERASRR